MFQRSSLWGALWTRGAYEMSKLWSFWSQKETTIMTIDPWLGRKSDEEVEDMEKPNSERWRTSNSHLEMISSDCCFQQSPAKLGWWTWCYDPTRSQHRGPCSLVTGDLMSYSRLYQYGKSDELRKRWGGWWCPLEDARSFTEVVFAAVAKLRWDHTICKNMLGAFETTTGCLSLSFTITIPGSLRRTIVVSNQTEGVMVHQGTEVLFL